MKPRYTITVHFEDEQYVATVADLDDCSGVGASYTEAIAAAEAAIAAWIAAAINAGREIPAPRPAAGKKSKSRRVMPLAPVVVDAAPASVTAQRQIIAELATNPFAFRRRRLGTQTEFWARFGVGQSAASRYERRVGARRKLPLPLALLVGLWALGRIDDRALASVCNMLAPHYPDRDYLALESAESDAE